MNHTKIYQYRFAELDKSFSNGWANGFEGYDDNQIFDISGKGFRRTQTLVSRNENLILRAVLKIIKNIMDQEGVEYFIPEFKDGFHPIDFIIKEGNRDVAYKFLFREVNDGVKSYKQYCVCSDVDCFKMCILQTNLRYKTEIERNYQENMGKSLFELCTLRDFYIEWFDEEDYLNFMNYAKRFVEKSRNLVGFNALDVLTVQNIKHFKNKLRNMFMKNDYFSVLPDLIDESQKSIIVENFLEKKRFQIMIGNEIFADSFLSSELYSRIYDNNDSIDKTGSTVGYYKSIEQLLYSLIRLFINTGRHIRKDKRFLEINDINGYIEFTETYEIYADTTLGSLIHFIKDKNEAGKFCNADIFETNDDTIQAIIDALYEFKDLIRDDQGETVSRNALLHKKNVYTKGAVEIIRKKAIILYCLLLGSFRLSKWDCIKLCAYNDDDLPPETINEEELTGFIEEWLEPILLYDIPKQVKVLNFIIEMRGCTEAYNTWNMYLKGMDDLALEENIYCNYAHGLKWKTKDDNQNEIEKIYHVLENTISRKKEIADVLKQYKNVFVDIKGERRIMHIK